MNTLFITILACMIFTVSFAYWIEDNDPADFYDEDSALETLSAVKRRHGYNACMPKGMKCIQNSKFRFARCCSDLKCVCNIWKTNCHCRITLF